VNVNTKKQRGRQVKITASENLIQKAVQGDEQALRELVDSIWKYVLYRTTYLLRNRMDAEDAAQETLIKVCQNIQKLQNPQAFNGWLAKIILNETRRYVEINSKHSNVLDISEHTDVAIEENKDYIPHESVDQKNLSSIIAGITGQLPQRQREAVLLHYYDGLNVTQTANAMEIQQQTVSELLKSARENIRKELKKKDIDNTILARGIMLLPLGPRIGRSFSEGAMSFSPDAGWGTRAWERCAETLDSAEKGPVSATIAKAPASTPVLPIVLSAVVLVSSVVAFGIIYSRSLVQPESTAPGIVALRPGEGGVLFTGGDTAAEHINPRQATAWGHNDFRELTARSWWITAIRSDRTLYSGEGGTVDGAFTHMRDNGIAGQYMLYFLMEDTEGTEEHEYTASRLFIIQVG